MNSSPVYVTVTRVQTPGQTDIMRIEAGDKVRPIVIIDMDMLSWANALSGDQVIAAISTGRQS